MSVAGGLSMGADQAMELMSQLFWNSLLVAAPVVGVAMLVGLTISVLQVATQLQEMTLSYVPKLLAATLTLVLVGPWMIHKITEFAVYAIKMIPALS